MHRPSLDWDSLPRHLQSSRNSAFRYLMCLCQLQSTNLLACEASLHRTFHICAETWPALSTCLVVVCSGCFNDQDQGNGGSHACAQKRLPLSAGTTSYAESKTNTATVPAPERLRFLCYCTEQTWLEGQLPEAGKGRSMSTLNALSVQIQHKPS